MADLERATGVDRSTLYASFGGKAGLYESAAEAYISMASEQLFSRLHDGEDGIDDILAFLDTLAGSYRAGQPRGCLVVNDMASVGELPTRIEYLNILRTGFEKALGRGEAEGEVLGSLTSARVETLVAAVVGINLTHRNLTDQDVALGLIDGLRHEVQSWRTG